MIHEDPIIRKLILLGENNDSVRAMILTSSRCDSNAPVDVFSDYDVEIFTDSPSAFGASDEWFEALGPVLTLLRLDGQDEGERWHTRLVLYDDGTRVDYQIAHLDELKKICQMASLPDSYDIGYKVLIDKDGVAASLKKPTYRAYIPAPPSESEYAFLVNGFWWNSTYVSKYLWRDDLMAAKFMLDHGLIQDHVLKMLEWSIEVKRGWAWRPGQYGRGLKKALDPDTYKELVTTYARGDIEELWESLFRTAALFRKTAMEVAESLGFNYAHDLDRRVTIYHRTVRTLNRRTTSRDDLARLLRESYEEERSS